MLPTYASREDVLTALDTPPTTRLEQRIDRLLQSATEDINAMCHRYFWPELASRTFDWPQQGRRSFQPAHRLYLDEHGLISLDELTVAGQAVASGSVMLRPDDGPPFTRIELDFSTDAIFHQDDTFQRAVVVDGLFGYRLVEDQVALLAAGINDVTTTLISDDGGEIGVGDLLRIGSERLVVSARAMTDSGQNLAGDLGQVTSDTGVQVSDGSGFHHGEIIMIGTEKMRINEIAGDTLVVSRSVEGTVLGAHTSGADIFVSRQLSVGRGVLGTTAASHAQDAEIYRFRFPALIRQLAIALTEDAINQEKAGYTRRSGSGNRIKQNQAVGIEGLRERVYWAHGRTARHQAV